MKNLILSLVALGIDALTTDPNDSDRLEEIDDRLVQIKDDIAASRGDSAFADPEFLEEYDRLVSMCGRATVAEDDALSEEETAARDQRATAEAAGEPEASDRS